jgi:hypothetical protein
MTGLTKPFRVEVNIDAPADTVWQALTEPGLIRNWFGWEYGGLEEEIAYLFSEHADPQPPDRVVLPGGQEIGLVAARATHTTVRIATTEVLPAGEGEAPDCFDAVEEDWRIFLQQLRFLLERHTRAGRRRTLRLMGRASGPDLVAALEPSTAKEVWHESRFTHLVVDRDEHLLAALAERPLTEAASGTGPVSLTVTAFGLDDEGFAELRERWTERWCRVVEEAQR